MSTVKDFDLESLVRRAKLLNANQVKNQVKN